MSATLQRIAFVYSESHGYMRRLAAGVCRFARPDRGWISKDFQVDFETTEPPPALNRWAPDGIVCFLDGKRTRLLESLGREGRAVVNTSRVDPNASLGCVVGDGDDLFDAVHDHFRKMGVTEIHQFVVGGDSETARIQNHYQQYSLAHDATFHSFRMPGSITNGSFDQGQIKKIDPMLANWLINLPKPVGLFTQHCLAGRFLCACCQHLGLQVPFDVLVIGVDELDEALACSPSLTAVSLPVERIGYRAAELVQSIIEGAPVPQEAITVPGATVRVRESTRIKGRKAKHCDIDAAQRYIDEHACEGLKVKDLITETQTVSRLTFQKYFVDATGVKPGQAILERKMREARNLLINTECSIGAIAGMCGYMDDLYFGRVFRKEIGVAPSVYRKIQKAESTV